MMSQSGITSFVTQKISWNQLNKFPHHTFLWEGLDGTQIFSHFLPADTYNADITATQLQYVEKNFRENDRATRSLLVYGWGDGGGGPTKGMLEAAARTRDFEGLPKVTLEKVSAFLPKAKEDACDLPVWVGELYLELHRGTYTTQARNKRGNRKGEGHLYDAEFFSVLAPDVPATKIDLPRAVYDVTRRDEHGVAAYLDRAWNTSPAQTSSMTSSPEARSPGSTRTARATTGRLPPCARPSPFPRANTSPGRSVPTGRNARCSCSTPRASRGREVVSLPDGAPVFVEAPPCGYAVHDLAAASEITPVTITRDGGKRDPRQRHRARDHRPARARRRDV